MERYIVSKFGGSSMADARRIERVAEIVRSDDNRRYVVVSAPGKRKPADEKITELLLASHYLSAKGKSFGTPFNQVVSRFTEMGQDLQYNSISDWLDEVESGIGDKKAKDWIASRGEWLMAKLLAKYLGGAFVDASSLIRLNYGKVDPFTYKLISQNLESNSVTQIIPGFYGANAEGQIETFPRNGSDITGGVIAKGVDASLYENWTDVDGVLSADPKVVTNPTVIAEINFREMRELGYRGTGVLHPDAIRPVFDADIPIRLRNTFNLNHPGTLITRERKLADEERVIGIAGKSGLVAVQIQKIGMNEQDGIGIEVLEIIKRYGSSFQVAPMGLDEISIILPEKDIRGNEKRLIDTISKEIDPTDVKIIGNLGLVCLVGEGIRSNANSVISDSSSALAVANIIIRAQDYGTSGNNIVIGVDGDKVEEAIRVLYNQFF